MRLDVICEGLGEGMDREIEALRRQGLPISVSDGGEVVSLSKTKALPE